MLQAQIAALVNEVNRLMDVDRQHIDREKAARRKLETLVAELQAQINVETAPIVRSLMHTPKLTV